jgi:hypothetical protein
VISVNQRIGVWLSSSRPSRVSRVSRASVDRQTRKGQPAGALAEGGKMNPYDGNRRWSDHTKSIGNFWKMQAGFCRSETKKASENQRLRVAGEGGGRDSNPRPSA